MSFNQSMSTITVGDVTYDVEEHGTDYGNRYTIQLDGEEMFEGLVGRCEREQFDQEHANPRDWCNVGTMALYHPNYNLGGDDDENIREIEFEVKCPTCDGSGESPHWIVGFHQTATALVTGSYEECQGWLDKRLDVVSGSYYIEPIGCSRCEGEGRIEVSPIDYFKQERKARVVLGVSMYEHSGITVFVGHQDFTFDPGGWDTSYIGFIYDTPEQIKQCIGEDATDEDITKALEQEVKHYASYLEGDVNEWNVDDPESEFTEGCGGFLADHEECERQMYEALEQALIKRIAEESERAYWLDREVLTV